MWRRCLTYWRKIFFVLNTNNVSQPSPSVTFWGFFYNTYLSWPCGGHEITVRFWPITLWGSSGRQRYCQHTHPSTPSPQLNSEYWESNREAVSTICKVFGRTQPGIDGGSTNLVQVLQSQDGFADVNTHGLFRKVIPLIQMSEHLTAAHIVCAHRRTEISPLFRATGEADALLTFCLSFLTSSMFGRGNKRQRHRGRGTKSRWWVNMTLAFLISQRDNF